jgi:hypothetical protein
MEFESFFGRPLCRTTADGCFIVSSLNLVQQGLQHFIDIGLIDTKGIFCDAGCGDGRVVALTAGVHQIHSIGIESDSETVILAKQKIGHLKEIRKICAPAKIIEGNFVRDETYSLAQIDFKEIKTFFNYVNNEKQIAAKIAQHSLPGTIFLLYDSESTPKSFSGLKFIETKILNRIDLSGASYYLHAYRK